MALLKLFIAALMPILKVLLVTALGTFLALERVNILGADARRHLNNVVFFVFSPALVGSSLAKHITYRNVTALWFMPLNTLMTFVIGSVLGWFVVKITRSPRKIRGVVVGCCATGNLGYLPFIILPAVCKEKGSPFGEVDACNGQALTYASLSMALGSIYMWIYVYNIIRIYSKNDSPGDKQSDEVSVRNPELVGEAPEDRSECNVVVEPKSTAEPLQDHSNCSPLSPQIPVKVCTNGFELERTILEKGKAKVLLEDMIQRFQKVKTKLKLGRLFAPSTDGAIVGFIIGVVPPFRKALIGDDAPLRVVQDSANMLGEACISAAILIMGANLLKGLKRSEMQLRVIVAIIIVRYVLLPIVGVIIVKFAIHFGFVNSDPLYNFALMLQYALPPAVGISTMTQLFGAGETECSVILLSAYALASVSMTLWSMFFMWLVR